jgi:signal transduction histidine kinase
VSGVIREAYFREWIITGALLLVILISAVVAIGATLRWSSSLQREVNQIKKDLDESQRKLVHSERLASIGKAAAIMSHEIKNPLMVIGGFARQLGQKFQDDPRTREKLAMIAGEVDRLEKMLGEVKDITRPTPLKLELGQLNGLVRGVSDLLADELEAQGIQLSLKLNPDVEAGRCLLDAGQIKQVLINLFKNAAEAMPDGGKLSLHTYREKEYHVVEVEDTGKGIRPEDLQDIFNPFFSTKQKGTGLGLAVSLKIVEDHYGDLRVSSEVGRGTIFKMRLPCHPPNHPGSVA